jgi:hypothetical protein
MQRLALIEMVVTELTRDLNLPFAGIETVSLTLAGAVHIS